MGKKLLKKKIILAVCAGSMFAMHPTYAADTSYVGLTAPSDDFTDHSNEITAKIASATGSVKTIGVLNKGYSNFTLSNPAITITSGAVSTSADANAYGIDNTGTTTITSDTTITTTAIAGTATGDSSTSTDAFASANVYGGVYNTGTTTITGDTTITTTATAGTAAGGSTIPSYAFADANAYGINNTGATAITGDTTITTTATAGTATGGDATSKSADAYAFGINNTGTTTITGDTTITTTATAGTATGGSATSAYTSANANAFGIYNTGTTTITGDTTITATTTAGTATRGSATAYAYALYTDTGTININQAISNPYTVKLTGDVLATDSGSINLTLNNSSSLLRGNVITSSSGRVNLTLANDAVWQPVYDNTNGTITYDGTLYSTTQNTINTLNLSDGIVNLTWDKGLRTTSYRNLTITTLSGTGGTFKINTDVGNNTGDTIAIGTLSSASNLKVAVNYDRSLGTITQPTTLYFSSYTPISIVTSGASNLAVSGVTTDKGAYSITPTFSGTGLTSLVIGGSTNTKAAASMARGQESLMGVSVNHLRKRLGDLRESPEKEIGVWARAYAGEVTNEKYTPVESDYKGMQLGYDKSVPANDGRKYIGGAVSFTKSDDSFASGRGNSKASDVALYQTWMGKDGRYYDIIAKLGRLNSNYNVTDLNDTYSTAAYDTWTESLSGEIGYKKQFTNGWYLEPQLELTLSRIHGVDYITSTGMSVTQDSIGRLTGRMGIGIGKQLSKNNHLYTSLSALHEFQGENNIKADTLHYSQNMSGTWYEFILGMTTKMSNHSNGYFNVEKLFGGEYNSNWQVNAGCRFNF